jgi:hypothetical protein
MKTYLKPATIFFTDLNELIVVKTQYQFNQTIQQEYPLVNGDDCSDQGILAFGFSTGGLTPSGDGTLTCSAVGDLDDGPVAAYTINFEGAGDLSPGLGGSDGECNLPGVTEVYNISLASLQAAAADGTIQVTATPGAGLQCFCDPGSGDTPNQVTCTLEFPAS